MSNNSRRGRAALGNPPEFLQLISAIASGDAERAFYLIALLPGLVHERAAVGASKQAATEYFLEPIRHYLYAGDTALHVAAAGFKVDIAEHLIHRGADCSARNGRGAEPLHYASDANTWDPAVQAATIACLIRAGSNPNSVDASGVAPIHRAVRTRSAPAVQALLGGGANPRQKNHSGSTPLHLAAQNTGRGGSGEPRAVEQQKQIIALLLQGGAQPGDENARGRTAAQAASAAWIRELCGG